MKTSKNKQSVISAEQANLPESIPASQRALAGEVHYPRHLRCADHIAGWRDAKLLRDMLNKDTELEVTPWMQSLRDGLLTALARNHRETLALHAPLRAEAVRAAERATILLRQLPELDANVKRESSATIVTAPTTSGEALESERDIAYRREREMRARIKEATARADSAREELNALRVRHGELREAFAFHCAASASRAESLRSYYAERQDKYVHAGLRGRSKDGSAARIPVFEPPVWAFEPLPSLPEEE